MATNKRHNGNITTPLVECLNIVIGKWRVRWDVQPDGEEGQVSFVEADFEHRPTPEGIEAAIARSCTDASDEELENMGALLECPDFMGRMESGRITRIQADPMAQLLELQKDANLKRTDISDSVALLAANTFRTFKEVCALGKELEKGAIIRYQNKPWRVLQGHTPQAQYPPSMETAALYARIDKRHAGTEGDPIPYEQGMAFEEGKYYTQYGVLYRCILTTETGYPNDLKDLPTIVKPVNME